MLLPALVRSTLTWDTRGPGDLRRDEEAVLLDVERDGDACVLSLFVVGDRPRPVALRTTWRSLGKRLPPI